MPRRATALLLGALLVPCAARANGRFPAAQSVIVGPGSASDTIVLRTTFGLVVSRDGGATFHWVCEEALLYAGQWDPSTVLAADGRVSVGLETGLVQTSDYCGYALNAGAGSAPVQDLTIDTAGTLVLGVQNGVGAPNHVLSSTNGGADFAVLGAGVDARLATVELAASNSQRVYVTAAQSGSGLPVLYRSDDGGATLTVAATDFLGGTDAFVSAVDASNPDRLWVRSNHNQGTLLLRSDDGGQTFQRVFETQGPMLGFAIADDGMRVWLGGTTDGLWQSDDGGQNFHQVADTHVTCLRYHAGALYLCAEWLSEGYALARWRDGAAASEPLVVLADVAGPFDCAAGTIEHDTCGSRWPAQQAMFVTRPDAGARDAAADARLDAATDASGADAGADTSEVGSEPPSGHGCACGTTPSRRATSAGPVVLALGLGLALQGARRRRRS